MIILVLGLPGSGKTTFAWKLMRQMQASYLPVKGLNGDFVRKEANDWDFSPEGRARQAIRMSESAKRAAMAGYYVVADFVCPTQSTREVMKADITVFMNTIESGRFEDTNIIFDKNVVADYHVTNWDQTGEVIDQILYQLLTIR